MFISALALVVVTTVAAANVTFGRRSSERRNARAGRHGFQSRYRNMRSNNRSNNNRPHPNRLPPCSIHMVKQFNPAELPQVKLSGKNDSGVDESAKTPVTTGVDYEEVQYCIRIFNQRAADVNLTTKEKFRQIERIFDGIAGTHFTTAKEDLR